MSTSATQRLIGQVSRRQQLALFATRFRWCALAAASVFFVALLASRLLAVIPNWFAPASLFAVPAVALLAALALTRRIPRREIARVLDTRSGSKELFLTAAMIEQAPGAFQPIVLAQAEERARKIAPGQVVPFRWQRGARDTAVAAAVLIAGVLWLPQLDPLGKGEEREKIAQQANRLELTRQETALRAEQLAENRGADPDKIAQALADLEKTFREAKPQLNEASLKRLSEHQKELGKMWRKVSNELPKDGFDKAAQSFGQADPKKMQQWREELKKGDVAGLKKELSELQEQMKQLASMSDSAEKRALQEKVAQQLNAMAETLKREANSPALNAALARAMQQLDLSKLSELGQDALAAAQESLQLSEQELEQLAQSMKDAQSLEDALKAAQLARQLAMQKLLDGEACKDCNGMGDYAALYASLCKSAGSGPGMGPNPGQGEGGRAPEDEGLESAFKPEKSPTTLTQGKMLLQWKTKEVGESGARAEDYREGIRQVKQGVSEAIVSEQVPPGYHATIQKYFDSLPEK